MAKREGQEFSTRVKFMVESITDLKNNKHKNKLDPGSQQERLKKFISNLIKKRSLNGTEPLRVGIQDIHNIATKGKWWLVGSAWAGHDAPASTVQVEATNDLLRLAKSQKMNTDVRKSIFVTLMSSEDYADAYERLLKLGLKDKQEREIVRVLIHCCSQEKIFNPYYAYISQRFCEYSYSFQITFQYALWDIFKASAHGSEDYEGKEGIRKMSHIARLFLHLLITKSISICILKSLNFTSLSPTQILFCQITIGNILLHQASGTKSEKAVRDIFGRAKEANDEFREGLWFFIQQYIHSSSGVILGIESIDKSFLKDRSKKVKEILIK